MATVRYSETPRGNFSIKNSVANATKICEIPADVVRVNIKRELKALVKNYSQQMEQQEFDYLVDQVTMYLTVKRKLMLFGSFKDVLMRGQEGKYGEVYKITVQIVVKWVSMYVTAEQNKKAAGFQENAKYQQRVERIEQSKGTNLPMAQAIKLRKEVPALFRKEIALKSVAELIAKGCSVEQIKAKLIKND